MRLIGLQYAPLWLDKDASHALIERLLDEAAPPPGSLVVLSEMSDTGWTLELDRAVEGDTVGWAAEIAARLGVFLQVGYAEHGPDGKGRNCTVIARPDGTLGPVYRKVHLFTFGSEGSIYGHGDTVVIDDLDGTKVFPALCYDLRFPELFRQGAVGGAEILTLPACWPIERAAHFRALAIARAIENQSYVVAVNRIGTDPTFTFGGGSLIVSPLGEVLDEAQQDEGVISATFDREAMRDWREQFPSLQDIHHNLLGSPPIEHGRFP